MFFKDRILCRRERQPLDATITGAWSITRPHSRRIQALLSRTPLDPKLCLFAKIDGQEYVTRAIYVDNFDVEQTVSLGIKRFDFDLMPWLQQVLAQQVGSKPGIVNV